MFQPLISARVKSVSPKTLHGLGYTHDYRGKPLNDDEQTLELFPQDFIVAKGAADFLLRTANYIDELLVRFYGMEPYYNADKSDDLVGHLICALAPHTSGGVLSRIIGWADCSGATPTHCSMLQSAAIATAMRTPSCS